MRVGGVCTTVIIVRDNEIMTAFIQQINQDRIRERVYLRTVFIEIIFDYKTSQRTVRCESCPPEQPES